MTSVPADTSAPTFTRQDWSAYSQDQHDTWSLLYDRRMADLEHTATEAFLYGAKQIGLSRDAVPDLEQVNGKLSALTGWSAVPVTGFLPAAEFFACLAQRRFPTTVTIRPRNQLEYITEPDIFHDVFGHVPMHSHPVFADFLQRFGAAAAAVNTPEGTQQMARLFWFTVEFGLIREGGEIKVYGSGLISSSADAANAVGPACERRPFVLQDVLAQDFKIDHVQPLLFVIDDYEQLFEAVAAARRAVS